MAASPKAARALTSAGISIAGALTRMQRMAPPSSGIHRAGGARRASARWQSCTWAAQHTHESVRRAGKRESSECRSGCERRDLHGVAVAALEEVQQSKSAQAAQVHVLHGRGRHKDEGHRPSNIMARVRHAQAHLTSKSAAEEEKGSLRKGAAVRRRWRALRTGGDGTVPLSTRCSASAKSCRLRVR